MEKTRRSSKDFRRWESDLLLPIIREKFSFATPLVQKQVLERTNVDMNNWQIYIQWEYTVRTSLLSDGVKYPLLTLMLDTFLHFQNQHMETVSLMS